MVSKTPPLMNKSVVSTIYTVWTHDPDTGRSVRHNSAPVFTAENRDAADKEARRIAGPRAFAVRHTIVNSSPLSSPTPNPESPS